MIANLISYVKNKKQEKCLKKKDVLWQWPSKKTEVPGKLGGGDSTINYQTA